MATDNTPAALRKPGAAERLADDGAGRRRRTVLLLSAVVTVASVVGLYMLFDKQSFRRVAAHWNPVYLLPGAACMFAYTIFGGLRMRLCSCSTGAPSEFVAPHAIATFLRGIIPAGLGEVAYAWLMRRLCIPQWARTLLGTIACRGLDVIAGFLLLSLFLPLASQNHQRLGKIVWFGMGGLAVVTVLAAWFVSDDRRTQNSRPGRLRQFVIDFRAATARMLASGILLPAVLFTFAMQVSLYGVYLCLCWAIIPSLAWHGVLALYLLLWPLSLIPVRGFLDLGTHEGCWVLALVALGYDANTGTVLAVISHVILFGQKFVVAAAATAWIWGRLLLRKSADAAAQSYCFPGKSSAQR